VLLGAAAATGFSWLVGGSLMALLLFIRKGPTRISIKDSWKPDWALLGRVVKLSVPAVLERICMSGAGIISAKAIASLGTAVIAANSIFSTAESMSFMPAMAFQTSCTTLVGQSLGAKKPKLAERYVWYNISLSAIILSFAGVALYVFSEQLCGIFTPDDSVRALAAKSLRIVSVIQPIQSMAWIFAGALRGAGDTKWPFYITAICNWGIRTLGVVICVYMLGFSLPSTIVCMCLDNTARCIWMFLRFRSGHWKTAIQG
jgi:putative MATE family efflux protein